MEKAMVKTKPEPSPSGKIGNKRKHQNSIWTAVATLVVATAVGF